MTGRGESHYIGLFASWLQPLNTEPLDTRLVRTMRDVGGVESSDAAAALLKDETQPPKANSTFT